MNLLLRYYRCVHVLVVLGVLAYSVAEENLVYAMIALPVVVAAYLIVGGPGGRPLPRWIINLALLGATVAMGMQWTEPLANTISVLCSYLVWLQLIKMFEPRTPRDQSQVIVLSLMLAVGACLTSVTPELGAVLALYVPVLLVTVMLYQVYAAHAHASTTAPVAAAAVVPAKSGLVPTLVRWVIGAGGAPEHMRLARIINSGPRARAGLNRCAWLAAAIIAAFAPFVYIGMPRGVGEAMFGQWQPASTPAVTGFRDHVQLGSQGLISESQRVVMKVKIETLGREETVDEGGGTYRLRGAVLDRYDPEMGVWRRSEHVESTDRRVGLSSRESHRPTNPRSPLLLVHITPVDQPVSTLFSVWRPLWAWWPKQRTRETYVYNAFDGQMEVAIRTDEITYTVVCAPSEPAPPGPQPYLVAQSPNPLSDQFEWVALVNRGQPMPEAPEPQFVEGRINELASRLLKEGRIDLGSDEWDARRRAVSLFMRHLQSRYTYTTQMTAPPPGEDPIEMFLFDTQRGGRGHCEYFASALAAMSLSVGIPARVVTGYVASEFDVITGTYAIRENHAHAWVEAEVRPGQWAEFDPSPSADVSRIHHPQGTVASMLRSMVDALQFAWIEGVVTFDRDRQVGALQGFTLQPLEALRGLNRRIAALLATEQDLAQENKTVFWTRLAGWSVLLIIGLVLGVHMLVTRGLRLISRLRGGGETRPIVRLDPTVAQLQGYVERLLRALAGAGAAKPSHRPALAHVTALDGAHASLVEPARRLVSLYYRARFAGVRAGREEVQLAGRLVSEVEAEASRIAASFPRKK